VGTPDRLDKPSLVDRQPQAGMWGIQELEAPGLSEPEAAEEAFQLIFASMKQPQPPKVIPTKTTNNTKLNDLFFIVHPPFVLCFCQGL
jgi:hypothetical protein